MKLNQNGIVTSATSFDSDLISEEIATQMYPIHIGEITGLLDRILTLFNI